MPHFGLGDTFKKKKPEGGSWLGEWLGGASHNHNPLFTHTQDMEMQCVVIGSGIGSGARSMHPVTCRVSCDRGDGLGDGAEATLGLGPLTAWDIVRSQGLQALLGGGCRCGVHTTTPCECYRLALGHMGSLGSLGSLGSEGVGRTVLPTVMKAVDGACAASDCVVVRDPLGQDFAHALYVDGSPATLGAPLWGYVYGTRTRPRLPSLFVVLQ